MALVALVLAGCGAPQPGPYAAGSGLDPVAAQALALRADDLLRWALVKARSDGLDAAFRGPALDRLRTQVGRMSQRGLRLEERGARRVVVLVDVQAREVVLEVAAEYRLVTPSDPDPSWAATLRQWWARLGFAAGAWWVVNDRELPPDQWRPLPPGYARPTLMRLRISSICGCG
jgi:hypothetical protein